MTGATRVCYEDYRRRQVGECADTWYKRIQPTYCTAIFVTFIIDKGMTLNLLQCLRVICVCRAVQTNSVETPLALLHMCVAI